MASPSAVRFSQGKKDIGDAHKFSWEYPVPDNRFWNDIPFTTARNFFQSFSSEEIDRLPIDPDSTLEKHSKLETLIKLLRELLAKKEAESSPKSFYDVDFAGWDRLWLAIYTLQDQLEDPEAEGTLRMLCDRRKDKTNLSHQHTLAGLLLDRGKFAEAEALEKGVKEWLDGQLGKDSPQALSARRIIAQAQWKQGPSRRAEANDTIADLTRIIDSMGTSQFAVYQEEEREMAGKLILDLKKGQGA